MLAVVFWNSRNKDTTDADYERSLSAFHEELRSSKPAGFRRSVAFRVATGPPWLTSQYPIFEDWYIMTNFAAMDSLDRVAIDGTAVPSHRALMSQTGAASGAVLYLEKGTPYVERCKFAYWFTRPKNQTADEILAIANPGETPNRASVWTRAMGLGPAGNCLQLNEPVALPGECRAVACRREVFWRP